MSLSRAPAVPASHVRGEFSAYVPSLLREPWEGGRIAAASVVFCDLGGFSSLGTKRKGVLQSGRILSDALADLIAVAESYDGDVLGFNRESITLIFTGEGRHGRAINAVHSMHDVLDERLPMSAGIATGLVHLIITGGDPRQLIAIGPTVTRAVELQEIAGPGKTRTETVDRSAIETQGKAVATPAAAFLAQPIRDLVELGATDPDVQQATIGIGIFSGVDRSLQRNPAKAAGNIDEIVRLVQAAAAEYDITLLATEPARNGGRLVLGAGVGSSGEDGEERMIGAVKAAVAGDPPFALRFGVATGDVLAGTFGSPTRSVFMTAGTTVDLAARLAASASPGEVLTTHRAVDRTTTRYAISEWEPVTFRGFDAQVVPVVVGAELDGDGAGARGALVGRSAEQAALRRSIEGLQSGSGGVVEIVGDAGIGKTRLVADALRGADVASVAVCGEEHRQALPYGAARRLLRAAMGIDEHEDPERAGVLLRAQVRDLTPYLEPLLPLIAEVIGAEVEPTAAVGELSESFRRERTQWAVSQLAVWLTHRPTVVHVEDAHWIDAASAGLLSYVMARGTDLPWLVVSTKRRGDTGWIPPDELDPTRLRLEPLAPGPSRALLTELRRDEPLSDDAVDDLVERSGGNPYLLERLAAVAGAVDQLPGNVESAAAMRLVDLDPAARRVVLDLSVLGQRFDVELAEQVIGVEDWEIFGDLFEPQEDGRLAFRHPILHDAAYAKLSAKRRRELHQRAAVALAERSAPVEVVSFHYQRAGDDRALWDRGRIAGKRALELSAPTEAATWLDQALSSARRLGSTPIAPRAETAELLGDAWCRAGRTKEGEKAYRAAEELAKTKRDRARLLHKRAMLRRRDGQYPAALRMLTSALKALPKSSGHDVRAQLELGYAGIRLQQGRFGEAIERCDRAISLATKADDRHALGSAHYVRARAANEIDAGSGAEDADRALVVFEEISDHLMQARVLDMLGAEAHQRGKWDEALALEERSAEQRDLAGDAVGSAVAGYHRARVLLDQGKLDDALEALGEIRSASRAANYPLGVAMSTMQLASGVARGGDSAAALEMLDETLARFEEMGAEACVVTNRLAEAEAQLLGGAVEDALATAEKTLEIAEEVEGVSLARVGLQRVRGVALIWMGKTPEGHVQLMEALGEARRADAPFEVAIISDALATLYGEEEAAAERDEIVERLGIVRLPPFLTVS